MKVPVIVAGTRTFSNEKQLFQALSQRREKISEILSGGAPGADALGEQWAHAMCIPLRRFLADWKAHGLRAGYLRNLEMVKYAAQHQGAALLFWDGRSPGTKMMIDLARKHLKPTHVTIYQYYVPDAVPQGEA